MKNFKMKTTIAAAIAAISFNATAAEPTIYGDVDVEIKKTEFVKEFETGIARYNIGMNDTVFRNDTQHIDLNIELTGTEAGTVGATQANLTIDNKRGRFVLGAQENVLSTSVGGDLASVIYSDESRTLTGVSFTHQTDGGSITAIAGDDKELGLVVSGQLNDKVNATVSSFSQGDLNGTSFSLDFNHNNINLGAGVMDNGEAKVSFVSASYFRNDTTYSAGMTKDLENIDIAVVRFGVRREFQDNLSLYANVEVPTDTLVALDGVEPEHYTVGVSYKF